MDQDIWRSVRALVFVLPLSMVSHPPPPPSTFAVAFWVGKCTKAKSPKPSPASLHSCQQLYVGVRPQCSVLAVTVSSGYLQITNPELKAKVASSATGLWQSAAAGATGSVKLGCGRCLSVFGGVTVSFCVCLPSCVGLWSRASALLEPGRDGGPGVGGGSGYGHVDTADGDERTFSGRGGSGGGGGGGGSSGGGGGGRLSSSADWGDEWEDTDTVPKPRAAPSRAVEGSTTPVTHGSTSPVVRGSTSPVVRGSPERTTSGSSKPSPGALTRATSSEKPKPAVVTPPKPEDFFASFGVTDK